MYFDASKYFHDTYMYYEKYIADCNKKGIKPVGFLTYIKKCLTCRL